MSAYGAVEASSRAEEGVDIAEPAQAPRASRAKLALLIVGGTAFAALSMQSRRAAAGARPELASANSQDTYEVDKATCWQYDDDSSYYVSASYCGPFDEYKYCQPETNKVSDTFYSLCAESCSDDLTWAMVCAWQAVANLPAACKMDGSFKGVIGERAANVDSPAGVVGDGYDKHDDAVYVAPAPLGSPVRLFSCDEHAVCFGCAYGNSSYCRAISDYYGGAGVPYDYAGTYFGVETWGDRQYVGANAAFQAINNDWDYWCSDATLAKVVGGTYNATDELVAIRDAAAAVAPQSSPPKGKMDNPSR